MNVFSQNSGKVNFVNWRKTGTVFGRYLKFWLEAQIKEKPIIPPSPLQLGARGIREDFSDVGSILKLPHRISYFQ